METLLSGTRILNNRCAAVQYSISLAGWVWPGGWYGSVPKESSGETGLLLFKGLSVMIRYI